MGKRSIEWGRRCSDGGEGVVMGKRGGGKDAPDD